MLKHERELRLEIRQILVLHGEGCDQPTPLEAPLYRRAAHGTRHGMWHGMWHGTCMRTAYAWLAP